MEKAELLKRERFNKILSTVYDYPVTVVEDPMGFGKTTAVRSFLKAEKNSPLWITFMRADEDTSYFGEKFVFEIAKIDENISVRSKALGFPADVPQFEKVLSLLNDVAFNEKTVLVVDDFHLSTGRGVGRRLLLIAAERIDNFHIIIITRDTMKIDFAEPLSKGLCHVISQQKLKFDGNKLLEAICLLL